MVDVPVAAPAKRKRPTDWKYRYLGGAFIAHVGVPSDRADCIVRDAWAVNSSRMVKLKVGDAVEFVRSKPPTAPATTTKKKGKATDGKLIHFRKPAADGKGASLDVGRLPNTVADWASALMAHDLVRLSGTVVECPKDFTTGSTILLSLRVEIARSAFASTEVTTIDDDVVPIDGPPPAKKHRRNSSPSSIVVGTADDWKGAGGSSKPKPAKKGGEGTKTQAKLKFDATSSQGGKKGGKDTSRKGAGFFQDLKETDREVALRERKSSLNKLFDALNLRPISTAKSKRNMLDSFDPAAERKLREELDGKDKGGKAKDKDAKGKKAAVRPNSLDGTDRQGKDDKGKGKARAPSVEIIDDEDEGDVMDERQVAKLYTKAIKNDLKLPCVRDWAASLT